jgi:hypothetical protein
MNAIPHTTSPALAALAASFSFLALTAAPARAIEVAKVAKDATLTCPANFAVKGMACVADDAEILKLTEDKCKGAGLAFVGKPAQCFVVKDQIPTPTCSGGALPLTYDKTLQQCVVKDEIPRSLLSEYLGDCFRIKGLPAGSKLGLESENTYQVRFQRPEGTADKMLTLALSGDKGTLGCAPVEKATLFDVKASDLQAIGANRAGWAFGVLALPYKYHTDDRSFSAATSVGPYFGRRWGTPGSAYTFAVAATIGSVKGEVRDAVDKTKIVETPDLQAFSLSAGFSYDVSKSPEIRPFKIGFFVGADWVGSSDIVKYKHNRKPWVALQIGYDFLD